MCIVPALSNLAGYVGMLVLEFLEEFTVRDQVLRLLLQRCYKRSSAAYAHRRVSLGFFRPPSGERCGCRS